MAKKNHIKKSVRQRAVIEALEPRLLFSADMLGGVLDSASTDDPLVSLLEDAVFSANPTQQNLQSPVQNSGEDAEAVSVEGEKFRDDPVEIASFATETTRHELVVVDSATSDYQQLIEDVLAQSDSARSFEVVMLESNRDGIQQITDTLQTREDLDAIHIISHGDDGRVQLGNTFLTAESLAENSKAISLWSNAFNEAGDILIYGCSLAESDVGESLINNLSELTQTDVAASDDLTGQASLGGDWDLEFNVGTVESEIAFSADVQQGWKSVLAAPVAVNDNLLDGVEDSTSAVLNTDILSNDSDLDGDSLTITHIDGTLLSGGVQSIIVTNGTVNVDASENITFTADTDYNGAVSFDYTISDGSLSDTASVSGTISAVNDAPDAVNDGLLDGVEDSTSAILNTDMLSNDSDVESDTLTITHINGTLLTGGVQSISVTNGTVNIDASDNITFSAGSNYNGAVSFAYTLSDGSLTDTATVSGTISAVNDKPSAVNDNLLDGAEDSTSAILNTDILSNDSDLEGDAISITHIEGVLLTGGVQSISATNGTVNVDASDNITFTADTDYNGAVSFEYTIRDGSLTDTATVSGTISAVNDAPVLDSSGVMSFSSITEDAVSNSGNLVSEIISSAGGNKITDADSTALEGIAISSKDNSNGNWQFNTGSGWTDVGAISISESLLLGADDSLRFVPDAENADTASITFSAWDQTSGSAGSKVDASTTGAGTAFSTVSETAGITVSAVNDIAVFGGSGTASVSEDEDPDSDTLLELSDALTILDPDSGEQSFQAETISGSYGSLDIDTAGNWTYTADNTQTVIQSLDTGDTLTDTFTVSAFEGTTTSVVITIDGAEDLPHVENPIADQTAVEESPFSFTFASNVFDDVDTGDTLTYSASLDDDSPLPAWLSFDALTRTFSGTPTNDDVGSLSVKVSADDGAVSFPDIFILTIKNTDDAPVIGGDTLGSLTEDVDPDADTQLEVGGVLTIADPDPGESVFQAGTVGGLYGNLVLDSSGNWDYSADNTQTSIQELDDGESIDDILAVRSADGTLQNITITITGAEDAPVISAVTTGAVAEDGTLTVNGTLSITDKDASDNPVSFADEASVAGDNDYGDFVLSGGTWTYTLDNDHASVQALDNGETLSDTHTYTASDGSSRIVTITINGAEDSPVITGTVSGSVSEDGTLTANGALAITDGDTSDNPISFPDEAAVADDSGYGDFSMTGGTWSYSLNNAHAAVQALDVGETLTDTHTFFSSGVGSQVVTVTISGAEDAPTLENAIENQTAAEGAPFSFTFASDVFADVDTSDSFTYTATLADDSPLPTWLSFDSATRAFSGTPDNDDLGVMDVKVTADDGSSTVFDTFTLTVNNTNNLPDISGDVAETITEDVDPDADTLLETSGSLTIVDPDVGESSFLAGSIGGLYGNLDIDTAGNWSYAADNTQLQIQQLDVGESINDILTVTTADGTAQNITITINGAEDAPLISADTTGSVTEESTLTVDGSLDISDTDASDNPVSFEDEASIAGDNGYGDFVLTAGTWTYSLNNGHVSVQALDNGETLNDSHTYTATDGSSQVVTVTINGAEDSAQISGTVSGAVTEDGTLTATGALTVTDDDTSDNPVSFPDEATIIGNSGFGDFAMTAGTWTYTLDNAHVSVQALDDGESLSDSHYFLTSSGDSQLVSVTINGAEDAPTVENNIPNKATLQDTLFNFTFASSSFVDVDTSDTLTYVATLSDDSPLPVWLSFDGTTRTFTGTPSVAELGTISIKVTADDGNSTVSDTFNLTVKSGGTAPAITGDFSGSVTEDVDPDVDTLLVTSGVVTIVDPTPSESYFVAETIIGTYGSLTIDVNGNWSFSADNTQSSIQQLDDGQSVTDIFGITTEDGTSRNITITLNGAEDSSDITAETTGSVAEDGTLSSTGTITITDIDVLDNPVSFADEASVSGDNGYGDFVLTGGTWTYTLDNSHATVQALDVGETLTDTHTFSATDSSPVLVTITISGAEDSPVITATTTGAVTEDTLLTATDSLAISDVDTSDNPVSFADEASTPGDNGYGDFVLTGGSWTYTLDTDLANIQALDAGQTLTDTHTFYATNGSSSVVTVTITGTEDLPTVENAISDQTAVEDSPFSFTFSSNVFDDIDAADTLTYSATLADDSALPAWLNFDAATRTFSGTPLNANVGTLDIKVIADDGDGTVSDTFVLTINNTDDAPSFGGDLTGSVTEDTDPDLDSLLEATGTLTVSDPDIGESSFLAGMVGGTYGNLTIDSAGNWSYAAANSQSAIQSLDVSESISDVLTVTTADGTIQTITITIDGTEDAAVITATTIESVAEEDTLTASGSLAISDVDTSDNPVSFADEASISGDSGYGDFVLVGGTWTYTLDNEHVAVQALDEGESLTDTHTFVATDSSSQLVTITINGTEDDPVITGTVSGVVAEDGTLSASGTLSITDSDSSDNPVAFPDEGLVLGDNGFGSFSLTGETWTYSLNNDHASVQALAQGESLTDTHTFVSSNGNPQLVSITINGTEDIPTVENAISDQTATEDVPFSFTFASIVFDDIDASDSLSYSASLGDDSALPTWLNFNSSTRAFSGTPENADVGILNVKVTADDGISTVSDTFILTINNVDDAPVITGDSTGALTEDLDPDSDNLLEASGALVIADPDVGESSFIAGTVGGSYGDLTIDVGGSWDYVASNSQSLIQQLDDGESISDVMTVITADGTTQTITITINGTEDAPVITAVTTGAVTEDGSVTASGTLAITDVDTSDNPLSFSDEALVAGDNGYGDFVLSGGTWTYTLNNSLSAIQTLDVSETLTDTHTYTATDGNSRLVTITINGAEDSAVITGTVTGSVAEDGVQTASGSLAISDTDTNDNPVSIPDESTVSGDNGYGSFSLTAGTWIYTLDNDHLDVQALDVSETIDDIHTFVASDGSTQLVTITISGAEDDSVVTATATGAVTEANVGDAPVTASGLITVSDIDGSDTPTFADVAATTGDNGYGSFVLSSGTWTYTLDQSTVQDMDAGDSVTDTITYTSTDSKTQLITVTVTGANDAAVISGVVAGAVTEGNIGDVPVTASGSITIADVDADDSPGIADVSATNGDNSYGSFILTSGTWSYTLDQNAVQDLDAGDTVIDTITYTATDSSTQLITVTITGANDGSVISGTVAGAVTEGNIGDAPVTVSGSIAIADIDTDDSPDFADVASTLGDNGYGSFVLSSGIWIYTLDQSAVKNLDAGDTVTDTITYTATDSSIQLITVTITGTNDSSVISGTVAGAVTEGNVGDAPVTATGSIAIADVDEDDSPDISDVASTAGNNGYGRFVLTSGTWIYTLDQNAVQNLDAGDTVTDTITYTATDSSTQLVTVTITGTTDDSVITATDVGAVTEGNIGDAPVTASGSIAIADIDADDSPDFADVASTLGDKSYGSFVLSSGVWTYTLDQSAVQDLDAGDTVTDTITYTATDSSTQLITVTITGANDGSVISGTVAGAVTEGNIGDAPVTATGSLAIADVDDDDSPDFSDVSSTSGDNGYGSFVLTSGTWIYTLDQSAVQDLDAGDTVTDTITYTATDSSIQLITVTITGVNDGSVISGTVAGAVTEGNIGDAPVTATGSIAIADVDQDDSPDFADVASTLGDKSYGSFVLSSGVWTYTLDQSAVQDLDAGDTVTDTVTYTATDSSTQLITVTITGTNDDSVISGTVAGAVTEGNIGDVPVTATGSIAIADVDEDDSPGIADVASTLGDNGYGSFVLSSGVWIYTLDQSTLQNLDAGDTVIDTITYTATDSSTQFISVTITGANDSAVITGTVTGAVTEGNIGDIPVTATGSIAIADVDEDDSPGIADVASTLGDNGYGSFVLSSGVWTYTLDQSAVQDLDAGDTVTDTVTYTATDSSTQLITVTITGTNDDSVISGTVAGAVTEGNIGDAPVTATGSLAIADVDDDDSPDFSDVSSTSGDNGYGSFVLTSGTWVYTLDQSAVQDMDAGDTVTDTITYTATDSSTQLITVTITGTNDDSVISGTVAGAVTEGNIGDAPVTATGSLAIADVDGDNSPDFSDVASTVGDNSYGSFVLSSGVWIYTLDQSTLQNLDAGDTVIDTITYTATDSSTQLISVTITGANDSAVITGTVTGAVTEGNTGDVPVTATGSIAIADVDGDNSPGFSDVASTSGDNSYGSFVLTSGTWIYTLDQNAVQNLDAGDTVTDTITYTATDSSTQLVTVTITGTTDDSVITATDVGAVTEGNIGDAPVTASGSITIADIDADDSPDFADVASTLGDKSYGSFVLSSGIWTYTLDQSAVQDLDAGDTVTDTITYTATDSSTQLITVTITGTNDDSVISGTVAGAVTEGNIGDVPVTATGSLAIADVDDDDSPDFSDVSSTSGDNSYGSFVLTSGAWTYTLDQSAVQDLDAGDTVTDTITYTATDSSTQLITVTITGTTDDSVITATDVGAVTEGNIGDAPVTASGSITIADIDADDSPDFSDVSSTSGDNGYGSFVLTSGTWIYTLDQSAVQDMDAGDTVTDTITYTATDSSTQLITVTITGADDASIISGTVTGAVTEGNVGDAPVTASGSISIADVDADDSPSFADVASTAGDNSYGSFVLSSGTWTYTLDQSAVQDLDAGDTVTDTITYTATDSSTQLITVTISGADDASIISGTVTGAVTEGNVGDAPVTASGSISIADVDADDSPSFADVASTAGDNSYGSFVLSSGTWTYTLDQSAVQDLDAGDTVTDTITYTATDSSTQLIAVTITGTTDDSVITATDVGAVTEGNIGDAPVTASGSIAIADIDADDSPSFADVASTIGDNSYGSFVLTSGTWVYTLDQNAVQNLDAGDTVTDTITYTATDSSTQMISVSISGSDDAAVITGMAHGIVTEGNVGDAPMKASGLLGISDLDADDSPFFADITNMPGNNGYGSFNLVSGEWSYTLDQSLVQQLGSDDILDDSYTFIASNGLTQTVTITIQGTDDEPLISFDAASANATDSTENADNNSEATKGKQDSERTEETGEDVDLIDVDEEESVDDKAEGESQAELGLGLDLVARVGTPLMPTPLDIELITGVIAEMDNGNNNENYMNLDKTEVDEKFIDLNNLDISPFGVDDFSPLQRESQMDHHDFVNGLDDVDRAMKGAEGELDTRYKLGTETAIGVTMSLSAGIVHWVLKGGSLMATFLSTVPLWKQLDPLPILGATAAMKKTAVKQTKADHEAEVEKIFREKSSDS